MYKSYKAYIRKIKNKDLEGSARWMTEKELKKNKDFYYVDKNKIYAAEKSGIVLVETKNGYYVDTTPTHNLIIGTTRSGKGQTFVLLLVTIVTIILDHLKRMVLLHLDDPDCCNNHIADTLGISSGVVGNCFFKIKCLVE